MASENIDNDIFKLCRNVVSDNLDQFEIVDYQDKYQNQVTMFMLSILMEEVDEVNRVDTITYIPQFCNKRYWATYGDSDDNHMWVIVNADKVYGSVGVTIENEIASIHVFYLDKLLRSHNPSFAKKLIDKATEFIKSKNCKSVTGITDDYNKAAHSFISKFDMDIKAKHEFNGGLGRSFEYTKKLE